MTVDAGVTREGDVGALVDSKAIVLVVDQAVYAHPPRSTFPIGLHTNTSVQAHLFWIVRFSVLTSNPSVLCPAGWPSL